MMSVIETQIWEEIPEKKGYGQKHGDRRTYRPGDAA